MNTIQRYKKTRHKSRNLSIIILKMKTLLDFQFKIVNLKIKPAPNEIFVDYPDILFPGIEPAGDKIAI
jgi:hypothetical protein